MILDLGLPDMDGVEVIGRIARMDAMPVIVLSARAQEPTRSQRSTPAPTTMSPSLSASASCSRGLRVALRHAAALGGAEPSSVFEKGELRVDLGARRVTIGGREVHLTPIEYRLLAMLVKHAGKVLTHRHLLKEVWGPAHVERPHYLRVYMANLRQKLEADPARPALLLTETGVGYRLAVD